VTQQAVTVLAPEDPAPASEKPAEPGAGRMRRWSPASDGALPAYQRALGTLARSQMIARRAAR